MKTMARIFAIFLMIALVVSIVGCGNTNQNGGNSGDVNGGNNQNVNNGASADNEANKPIEEEFYQKEDIENGFRDVEYTPNEENLIGVAIYPVFVDAQKYAYNIGDLVPIEKASSWRTMYITYFVDDEGNGGNLFEGTREMWKWSDEEQKFYGECELETEILYVGYVYELEGKLYILTTHDLVNFQDGVGIINVKTIRTNSDGDNIAFDLTIHSK